MLVYKLFWLYLHPIPSHILTLHLLYFPKNYADNVLYCRKKKKTDWRTEEDQKEGKLKQQILKIKWKHKGWKHMNGTIEEERLSLLCAKISMHMLWLTEWFTQKSSYKHDVMVV